MTELTKQRIGLRLNEILAQKEIKQKELAEHIGVTPNTVSYYLSGERCPDIEKLIEIAKFLNVSTDYLLGISNVKTANTELKSICEYTGLSEETVKWLNLLCHNDCSNEVEILSSLLTWESEQPSICTLTSVIMNLVDYSEEHTRIWKYLDEAYKNKDVISFDEFEKIGRQSEKDLQYAKTFLYDAVFDFKKLVDDYVSTNIYTTEKEDFYERFWNEIFKRSEDGE